MRTIPDNSVLMIDFIDRIDHFISLNLLTCRCFINSAQRITQKKENPMKKIAAAVLACLVAGSVGVANASQTISVGYAQTQVNITHSNQMPGFNVKYHWEDDGTGAGVIGSFAYTTKNASDDYASGKLTYYSVTAGPSYRFNNYVNIYALLGLAYGKIEQESAYQSFWESSTAFAYGAGVQFNPVDNVAVDASYVYTQFSGDNDNVGAGTWMLGVGYRF